MNKQIEKAIQRFREKCCYFNQETKSYEIARGRLEATDNIESFLTQELLRVQRQTREEFIEEIEKQVEFGILPDPNPFGKWVSIKKHNELMKNEPRFATHS